MTDKTKNTLQKIETAALRAKDLTQQLLLFSKGGSPVKEAADLKAVIIESADTALQGKDVTCNYTIADDLWHVEIDKRLIGQVVQNIITNSCDAMPDGGAIEVVCRNVEPAAVNCGGQAMHERWVQVVFQDTGKGIQHQIIDNIFDPFFTSKKQGSGLGLAICHSIITKHGGTIEAASDSGKGAVFTITLPALEHDLPPIRKPVAGAVSRQNSKSSCYG